MNDTETSLLQYMLFVWKKNIWRRHKADNTAVAVEDTSTDRGCTVVVQLLYRESQL